MKKNDNMIYSIYINKANLCTNKFEIIFCCVDKCFLYEFNYEDNYIKTYVQSKSLEKPGLFSFEIYNNNITNTLALLGESGVFLVTDLFSKIIIGKITEIYSNPIYRGILLEKNIIAFISIFNLFDRKQKFKLITYNISSKAIKELEFNNQFNLSQNNLTLMEIKIKERSNKILLCACKRYIKGQKNGILALNYNINDNNEIFERDFYETKDFEPFCFCQISFSKRQNILNSNSEMEKSNYFLVGGFDLKRRKGIIKLYNLIYNNQKKRIIIQFIEDIIFAEEYFDKNKNTINSRFIRFIGPISSIIQTENEGNILISFWNGNVCLFSFINIDYFINKKTLYNQLFK